MEPEKNANGNKCLRNVFGDYITENVKMANLLNFRFPQLGQYKGPKVSRGERTTTLQSEHSVSVFVTDKEIHDALRHLKVSRPQNPSSIPAWALKDSASEIFPHLSFIINQSVKELSSPKSLKKAIVIPIFKRETKRIQRTIDQNHSPHVYQKILKLFSETKL